MSSEVKTGKNVCFVCGEDTGTANNVHCPICEDKYFIKIRGSFTQTLEKFNNMYIDLFKLNFGLAEDFTKSLYDLSTQYLELEKNLRVYNPAWYYLLTSYQFSRNLVVGNTIQSFYSFYSGFIDVWKTNHLTMSQNIIHMLENMNEFCKTINVAESNLSETDKNLIKMIIDVNRTYNMYQKESSKSSKPDAMSRNEKQLQAIRKDHD